MSAKVARFYSWSYSDIMNLTYCEFLDFYKAIDIIEAQEMLIKMQISDYPQMKQQGRQKLHRSINRMAYPSNFDAKVMTSEDMAAMLGKEMN